MGRFSGNYVKLVSFVLTAIALTLALPRLSQTVFPPVPEPSPGFDCDDSTLLMYRHFQKLGIESVPGGGNLKMKGEAYMESDHVWLLVKSGKRVIAYDWGTPRFDRQHYEGYAISLEYLLYAVEQDRKGVVSAVAAGQ